MTSRPGSNGSPGSWVCGTDCPCWRTSGSLTTRFPSLAEFLRRYVPGSPVGFATTHMSEDDKRKVVADLEVERAPWLDADGLRITMEANTGVARR